MNAARRLAFAAIAAVTLLASAPSSAQNRPHRPHPPTTVPVPQPVAPSSLPYAGYDDRYGYGYSDGYDDGYGDHRASWRDPVSRAACIAREGDADPRIDADASSATTGRSIDWCALPPYESRYEPQVPASWWWHHSTPWRRWGQR